MCICDMTAEQFEAFMAERAAEKAASAALYSAIDGLDAEATWQYLRAHNPGRGKPGYDAWYQAADAAFARVYPAHPYSEWNEARR